MARAASWTDNDRPKTVSKATADRARNELLTLLDQADPDPREQPWTPDASWTDNAANLQLAAAAVNALPSLLNPGVSHIEVFKGRGEQPFRFRLVARNGEIIVPSEGYTRKSGAQKAAEKIFPKIPLVDLTKK